MTSTVPNAIEQPEGQQPPITMFGPDFPYAYDDFLAHPAGLGQVPATEHGTEIAVIGGGLSGIVAAYELMKMGLKPVVYEADRIGGRLRTVGFEGCDPSLTAEMGAMRFPRPPRRCSTTSTWSASRPGRSRTPSRRPPRRPSSTSRASPTTPRPWTICHRSTGTWPRHGPAAWRRAPTSPT